MPSNRFVSFEAKFKMVGSEHDPNRIISDSHHQNDHNQFNLQREKFANKERERRETISLRFERKNTKIFENSLIPLLLLVFHLLSASTSSCLMVYATEQEDIAKYPIHKQMTKQDLLSVFYVDSHDKVPEYELSSVRFLSKRSISKNQYSGDGDEVDDQSSSNTKHVQLKAFGKKMSLKLQDNNDFNERVKDMKVFIAESSRNGKLKYMEDLSASDTKNFGTSYHDVDNMAAIMLDRNSKGKMQLHGTIGNDLVIKPIPETVGPIDHPSLNEIDDGSEGPGPDDDEMFLNEDDFAQMRDYNQTTTTLSDAKMKNHTTSKYPILKRRQSPLLDQNLHVIFKRNVHQISPHHSIDFAELEHGLLGSADIEALRAKQWLGDLNATLSRSRSPRRKRQAPGTVWPEVLLVVDYDSFMLHGATSRDVKRYFISFWNGVDLRYKLLVHPQIRVSLAGMIVAKDRDATPYLERNRLRPPNADAVDAAGALTDMGKYLYREDRLPTYDMAVVITKLDMCRRRYEGGRCNRGTAGFAYVGGACVVNKRLEKVNSVAIIEDSGGYSGIIVAAHEVGHLLGCVHDGSPPPSYLGGPGATHCPWEDGFIMSDLRHTERGFRWSSCSVEQFKHFLNGETATCLYNFPHENQLLPRVLPGSMLSLDEQCKRDRGTNACFKDGRVCAQLFCFDSASGYCVSYRPAAEGSPCGDGQICRNGKCLAEMENIIPDYSHVQQAISRGPKSDRILSRIDHGPMHHHLPPYRRSLRFRGRESFFNNYLRGAASEQQPNVLSMI
ncbi:A disintegrin and metalloproteinase with thrombospondin motifs 8 [Sarcoptes scabiei]|uniref:A disintegrin and metalloproteinase with thrombospondin motifs 8 n=1 Tax=Sarcoptes scabiei TaxID=52283 RepID=A0A834R210_SARSC|nr:A disintegrin and metalloproteinase with thrombospondin motifs 8 [Sarcoptes scabiei]